MEVTFWIAIIHPHSSHNSDVFLMKKRNWLGLEPMNITGKLKIFLGLSLKGELSFSYYYFSCDCYLGETLRDGWMDIWLLHTRIWIHLSLQNFCFSSYSNSFIYKSRKWNYLDWTIRKSTTIFGNNYLTWETQYMNC